MRDPLDRFPFCDVNKLGFVWSAKSRKRPYPLLVTDRDRIQQGHCISYPLIILHAVSSVLPLLARSLFSSSLPKLQSAVRRGP